MEFFLRVCFDWGGDVWRFEGVNVWRFEGMDV